MHAQPSKVVRTPHRVPAGFAARAAVALTMLVASVTLALPRAAGAQEVVRRVVMGGTDQELADRDFRPRVARPAYTASHPRVLVDAAHANFFTVDDRFKPFADLLAADGYVVASNTHLLDAATLAGHDVLVIAGARGGVDDGAADPAFRAPEIAAVVQWVRDGGSLLFVSDEAPFSGSVQALAQALGVDMSGAVTRDTAAAAHEGASSVDLLFTDANGLLGAHPILLGRDASERIHRVETFGGQSLAGPVGAVALLRMSPTAIDVRMPTKQEMDSTIAAARANAVPDASGRVMIRIQPPPSSRKPAAGRAQALAFEVGKGRVVVLGESAALTALLSPVPDGDPRKVGLNVPGTDDQQFALNVMHWLSRLY